MTIASHHPEGTANGSAGEPLRIGVGGHRLDLLDGLALEPLQRRASATLALLVAGDDGRMPRRPPVVISALAEGADRVFARAAIALGAELRAVLPFPRAAYALDFASAESRAEFAQLLAAAADVVELEGSRASPATMDDAYAAVGEALLDRSDVLVAVWNGLPERGPGGTAVVIRSALARGLPVVWIAAAPPHAARVVSPLPGTPAGGPVVARLAALKRIAIPTGAAQ